MTDLTLRRAEPGDAAGLALLGGATFFTAFAHDHPGDALVQHVAAEHSQDYYRKVLADPGAAVWLLETELKTAVGYAMMAAPQVDCATGLDDLELKRLYLLGPWQKGGWGARLVDALEREARARGATRLLLCVYTANLAAQRFYARLGFADTGHGQRFMVGDVAFDDRIWAKPLT
ncbi:GNAT family N-acetyltransferase [uncultured Sphingomonas sp.]|uniref:GNAT family N-acetyltransferase n=1 Tax=uncultured Sphingomonas sp. TaxID=158754 RepID=UPI0025F0BA18|nr:GNAT family N-acetyltransferase [uncultured Sphingomonas sp.]